MGKHIKPDIPFNVAVPLHTTHDGLIVTFMAQPEDDVTMWHHYTHTCGWTRAQFRKIENYKWFRVEVSAWYDGECLHTEHLGCCSYKTVRGFILSGDYFASMEADTLSAARRILKDRAS